MTVREYSAATDAEKVSTWWQKRHGEAMPLALLPPVGVVVEDSEGPACALWLYLTVGQGVCFPEWPVSAPGLSMPKAREAFMLALETLESVAKTHDYNVMICNTLPAIARVMKHAGFEFSPVHKVTGIKILT